VSGTVTFDGKPVEKGNITFLPVDGKSANTGGEIVGGKYKVKNPTPGKSRVEVSIRPDVPVSNSMGDAKPYKVPPEVALFSKAVGNNQVQDISDKSQVLDITLTSPGTK